MALGRQAGRSAWAALGLSERVAATMMRAGFEAPTEIQSLAIPELLSPRDAILVAETGSGKTLAYLAPLADKLADAADRALPAAVVLAPTQELVLQIMDVVKSTMPELYPHARALYGPIGPHRRDPFALAVATPKALRENIQSRRLEALSTVVLDEADMLLSGDYANHTRSWLLKSHHALGDARPQHIFCAATMPAAGKKSVRAYLDRHYPDATFLASAGHHRTPAHIQTAHVELGVDESLYSAAAAMAAAREASKAAGRGADVSPVELHLFTRQFEQLRQQHLTESKFRALVAILAEVARDPDSALEALPDGGGLDSELSGRVAPTLVFVNTGDRAIALTRFLATHAPALQVAGLHKGIPERRRAEEVARFQRGEARVLICTDVGSRGLDTVTAEHVIQLDFALNAVNYLHRNGRTGRMGRPGRATCVLAPEDVPLAATIATLEARGEPIDRAFSRRRGFRKRLKRAEARNDDDGDGAGDGTGEERV